MGFTYGRHLITLPPCLALSTRAAIRSDDSIFFENGDGACPAGGCATNFRGKAGDEESVGRQRLEIMQLLEVAIADVAAGLVAFPDQPGIAGGKISGYGVTERSVPAPAVGACQADAALEQVHGGLIAHSAA